MNKWLVTAGLCCCTNLQGEGKSVGRSDENASSASVCIPSTTINHQKMDYLDNWKYEKWSVWFIPGFCGVIMLGLDILSKIIPFIFGSVGAKMIPIKGKHLDEFSSQDNAFIFINKLLTIVFVYSLIIVCNEVPTIKWKHDELSIYNTLVALIGFYIVYDFFYMTFHRILHWRSLYSLIHKHHHRQKAPSRGNLDAINVHPFEFLVGEYLHLLAIYLIPCHIYTVVFFILAGGILASLNHTRYDISIPYIYDVSVHDVHHRLPESNYGQYTMFWDRAFGTYRPYNTCNATGDEKDD